MYYSIINFLLLLVNDFWTRNAGEPIKSSIDSDYSLVSNKNLGQKIPFNGWGPGPGDLSWNGLKPTPFMTSVTKNLKPKIRKKIFHCRLEDIFWSFEQLSSSIA